MIKEAFVAPDMETFDLSIEQVARYSGGSGYTLDAKKAAIAGTMLEKAVSLALPAYSYSSVSVLSHKNGQAMQLPHAGIDCPVFISSRVVGVVALICTIGPELEKKVTALNQDSEFLEAFFLDAAGLVILEGLSNDAYKRIKNKLKPQGLYPGCRWEPGCEKTSLKDQKILFDLLLPDSIGVTLSDSYVFSPYKTLSCWIPLTENPMEEALTNKCRNCSLKNCLYRQNKS